VVFSDYWNLCSCNFCHFLCAFRSSSNLLQIKDWIDDYKRHKKWKENIENSPNVFEEFTKKPKTEKERLKDMKEDF